MGSIAITIFLRYEYELLFSFRVLNFSLPKNLVPLLASSFLVSSTIHYFVSELDNRSFDLQDTLVFAALSSVLPAGVVFLYTIRVGILSSVGSTFIVENLGHFLISIFIVFFYVGIGSLFSASIFTIIFIGSIAGQLFVRITSYGYQRLRA